MLFNLAYCLSCQRVGAERQRFIYFEKGSHVTQAGLEFVMQPRMTSSFSFSSLPSCVLGLRVCPGFLMSVMSSLPVPYVPGCAPASNSPSSLSFCFLSPPASSPCPSIRSCSGATLHGEIAHSLGYLLPHCFPQTKPFVTMSHKHPQIPALPHVFMFCDHLPTGLWYLGLWYLGGRSISVSTPQLPPAVPDLGLRPQCE